MHTFAVILLLCLSSVLVPASEKGAIVAGNRLTHLDSNDPFYVGLDFPKLTTPQWIGESGVDAVITLGIDDMGANHEAYEQFLRPILERLKRIDDRAPVSIFCNAVTVDAPHLQRWLAEGVSLEVHTLHHPCPILGPGGFEVARNTFHGGVDLLNHVPGNKAVAFRTPCCDSQNTPSPRLFADIFNRTTSTGEFLTMDSSVLNILTAEDPALKREWVLDADGREKFRKYVPFKSFVTTIENYPYPYVIGKLCWEFPPSAPSDWQGQHLHQANNPQTVADWRSALDCIVTKQGVFNLVFHPHNWIRPEQVVELIDYAMDRYGKRVKFLTFGEAQARLNENLLSGQPLRGEGGRDNGVRLADLNNDGFIDVVIANEAKQTTRLWQPKNNHWLESSFPVPLVINAKDNGVRFGILQTNGLASIVIRNESAEGAWHFDGNEWKKAENYFAGLDGKERMFTSASGHDTGVRLRDVDGDGQCELIAGSGTVYSRKQATWEPTGLNLPPETSIVNAAGQDNGLRFVDVNKDGFDDVVFSNEDRYAVHLYVSQAQLGWNVGWSRQTIAGKRGDAGEIPPIARAGEFRNNGAWFHSNHLWVQNEQTAHLPDLVDRRSFDQLLNGNTPLPLSPEAALETFELPQGFTIELVAAEPLVRDPVAFEWDASGKLWVVEMGDYPRGSDDAGKSGGTVKILEDTDGDGRYDKATQFLTGLNFPTGVMPWRKGVLVSAAPEIFYVEDTDGDGAADQRKVLFSGFVEGNQQHRVNGFSYGLDGWLYAANGDSGGDILSHQNAKKTNIANRDFRIHPDIGLLETEPGQTQFGRQRDDWGNWFGNNNATWLWHYWLPDRYLSRNPQVAAPTTRHLLANYPENTRVFPRSRSLPRPNQVGVANHVTSANSATPYRDELFGEAFARSVFVSEPVHNVVHREVLQEDGVTFVSNRAASERHREFLTSTDNWFRPTMLKTGPDGALYIADMYRLVIEHPEYMPADMIATSDFRAGEDRGRIYRVYPEGAKSRAIPNLAGLNTKELVGSLDSPNGWQRDTAQRLLIERNDASVAEDLRALVQASHRATTRLHAFYTLAGLSSLKAGDVGSGLIDPEPRIREHALRLSESFLRRGDQKVLGDVVALARDNHPRVRYQLAFTLGESSDQAAGKALAQLALQSRDNEPLRIAVLSSAMPHIATLLTELLKFSTPPSEMLQQLTAAAAGVQDSSLHLNILSSLTEDRGIAMHPDQMTALVSFVRALKATAPVSNSSERVAKKIAEITHRARREIAESHKSDDGSYLIPGLQLLALQPESGDTSLIAGFLRPQFPPPVQAAALEALGHLSDADVAESMIEAWQVGAPAIRSQLITALLSRPEWSMGLLHALRQGAIPSNQLTTAERQHLVKHSDEKIRSAAETLFASASDRKQVVERYSHALSRIVGNAERGREVFQANCAVCHRAGGEGIAVGPDLGMVAGKPTDWLLTAILDPNAMVDGSFVAYNIRTRDEREWSGIIAAESASSVTLKTSAGTLESILRQNVIEMTASGLSLMPEGFEQTIAAEKMADLVAFLNASGPPPKTLPGNKPKTVTANPEGQFRLTPTVAHIYGDSIVIESQYGNLGWWTSENDRVAWSMKAGEAATYDLWLDWALAGQGGYNSFTIEITPGYVVMTNIAFGTGTWDQYKQVKIGSARLPAGTNRLTIRPVPSLNGALMDLRELRLVKTGQPSGFNTVSATPSRKTVPGNQPRLISPQPDGSLLLTAADCEIYGDKIAVYEPQRCLGWWTSDNDRVVWTFETKQPASYDVALEWAITDEWANNKFLIECGSAQLRGIFPSTGSFENYRTQRFGTIQIEAGKQQLTMRSEGAVKGELVDLRRIILTPVP